MSEKQEYANVTEEKYTKVFENRGLKDGREIYTNAIKHQAAKVLAEIDSIPIEPGNSECGRLVSLAKTSLEESVMWAVKAVSRS